MAQGECQIGSRFHRCHGAVVESCQYCGRRFCSLHKLLVEGYEAVCKREACRRKQEDLAAHLVYRTRVSQRNAAGLCGVEDCGPHPPDQCSLCQGHFCGLHLHERVYPFREGRILIERRVSICGRCWDRRKIWRR